MRIGIVYFAPKASEKTAAVAKALQRSVEALGHTVDLINASLDTSARLTMYEYLLVGTVPVSFFTGKISDRIAQYFQNAGMVSGKRSFAFIVKSGLGSGKALTRLMKVKEKEGMFVNYSDVFAIPEDASETARRLPLSRP
jgi:flavodoxin